MNWNPTAYPGGTSLKPLKIDLIWVLTEHPIKDLLVSLTILYCVGRDLMAAPFSSANIMIGLFEDNVFSLSGAAHFHLTSKWLGQPVFSAHHPTGASRLYVFRLLGRGWGVWEEGAGRPGRKEGIPIHLRQWR